MLPDHFTWKYSDKEQCTFSGVYIVHALRDLRELQDYLQIPHVRKNATQNLLALVHLKPSISQRWQEVCFLDKVAQLQLHVN